MARRKSKSKFEEVLDTVVAEETVQPQANGWESLSDEEKLFEATKREQIVRERDEEISQLTEVHKLRKDYLCAAFCFVSVFSVFAMACLVLGGRGKLHLSDAVLIALLTTTMANVIGVLCIAFKWLFPRK